MTDENIIGEIVSQRVAKKRVQIGLVISFLGLIILILGAKPEWFGLDRSPVVGFVQTTVILIGLGIICLAGYIGLAALWGGQEKSIVADFGLRLIGTGYVVAVFAGMADVFGMTLQKNAKVPFFGPWQAAGLELGMLIIAIGVLMIIPYHHLKKEDHSSTV